VPQRSFERKILAPQNLKNLFKFHSYLFDYLLTLSDIGLCIIARKTLSRATDREALVIEETSDLANDQNVLTLIITSVTPPLYRF
jgi:hypothetical protein